MKLKRSWCPCPGLVLLFWPGSPYNSRGTTPYLENGYFFLSVLVLSFTLAIYLYKFQAPYLSHCDLPWKMIPWVPPFKSSSKWKTSRSFVRRKTTKAMETQSQNCCTKWFYLCSSRSIISQYSNSCVKLWFLNHRSPSVSNLSKDKTVILLTWCYQWMIYQRVKMNWAAFLWLK